MMQRAIIGLCSVLLLVSMNVSLAEEKPVSKVGKQAVHSAKSAPEAAQTKPEFPVVFADTEIFIVSTSPVGSLSPENRAKLILQNIQNFANSEADLAGLKVVSLPEGFGVGYEDQMLMVITDHDAEKSGKSASDLVNQILVRIQAAVEAYRSQHAWKTYGMGAAFTFLAIIGLWLTLHWNNKAYAWLIKKMDSMAGSWKKEIRFKNIKVLSAARIELVLLAMLKMLRIFIVLLCLHFFLPLILSFFPETHSLSSRIFGYILTPFATIFHTAIKYIPNLFSSS